METSQYFKYKCIRNIPSVLNGIPVTSLGFNFQLSSLSSNPHIQISVTVPNPHNINFEVGKTYSHKEVGSFLLSQLKN